MPIIRKLCPVCGEAFKCWKRPRREHKTCSRVCGAQLRWKDYKPQPPKVTMHPIICKHCGKPFYNQLRTRQFCSYSCSSSARWQDPAFVANIVPRMKNNENQRRIASERMKRLNKDPNIRAKSTATKRGRSFSSTRGGNGQLTPEQLLLQKALGWPVEYPIPTGNPSWRCATVNLAFPGLKIAVECDGASHRTKKQKNRDARKKVILEGLGWTVLRFWNSEITGNLDTVLARIRRAVEVRSEALSPSAQKIPGSTTLK